MQGLRAMLRDVKGIYPENMARNMVQYLHLTFRKFSLINHAKSHSRWLRHPM